MKFNKISSEVFYAITPFVTISKKDVQELEEVAKISSRKRSRVCTHLNPEDKLHEMFIIHFNHTYVRPHFHLVKSESFHVISGEAEVVIFNDKGDIINRIPLGDFQSGKDFYYRIGPGVIHSLNIISETLVFHESTLGPFSPAETNFPIWAPEESEAESVHVLMRKINTP